MGLDVTFFTIYHEILADTLTRLSFSLKMAVSDKSLPEGEPPSVVHLELKELITQIIQKAVELPSFKDAQYGLRDSEITMDLDTKNYEDILATAILNKVVSRHQKELKKKTEDTNFSIVGSKIKKKHTMNSLGNLDGNIESVSESSTESVDEYNSWSESSHHEPLSLKIEECIEEVTTRYNSDDEHEVATSEIDRFLSSMKFIKRQKVPFPEFGMDIVDGQKVTSDSEGGDDEEEDEEVNISVGVELINPVDSWEENWLFQRRKLKTAVGTCQPVPVPMLVPNPSQDYRALIGDVDADETSDLSECSDSVLEDLIDGTDLKSFGKHSPHKDVKDEEVLQKQRELFLEYVREDLNYSSIESHNKLSCNTTSSTKGITPDSEQELAMEYIEMNYQNGTKNNDVTQTLDKKETNIQHLKINNVNTSLDTDHFDLSNSIINEAINPNIPIVQASSGEESLEIQKDSEYTVHYAAIAQLEPTAGGASPIPTPKPRSINVNSMVNQNNPFPIKEVADPNNDLEKPPLPGSIAEREHKKWLHAPPIPNNPYSKENIERRQKKIMYTNKRSSSETSIEFPEVQKEPSLTEIGEKSVMKDYTQYVRDYYVNVNTGKEVSVLRLEEYFLRGDLIHITLQANGASPHFKMNPLFEESNDCKEVITSKLNQRRSYSESGYASSIDSINSSINGERLTLPPEPEIIEKSFLTLKNLRKEKKELTFKKRKLGGSLRLHRSKDNVFLW
uniref:Uncharacterized protein n=1 Tax=Clastoptera arizonana TaxID=38151 RepID=A0A1B6CYW3_9HEMI